MHRVGKAEFEMLGRYGDCPLTLLLSLLGLLPGAGTKTRKERGWGGEMEGGRKKEGKNERIY